MIVLISAGFRAFVPEVNRERLSLFPLIMFNPVALPGLFAKALPLVSSASRCAAPVHLQLTAQS